MSRYLTFALIIFAFSVSNATEDAQLAATKAKRDPAYSSDARREYGTFGNGATIEHVEYKQGPSTVRITQIQDSANGVVCYKFENSLSCASMRK